MSASDKTSPRPLLHAPIRWWTVGVGLLLLIPNAYWVVEMHLVTVGPYTTILTIFANCIFLLLLLQIANSLLRRWRSALQMSRAELLLIYTILNIGSALASLDMMPVLVEMMTHPFQGTTETVRWLSVFGKYLPRDLMVPDTSVLHGYFYGNDTLYRARYLRAWLPPLLRWSAFIFALLVMMLCASSLLRKQWVEHERLTFPTILLPLRMTEEDGSFWRNRLLWAGLLVAGGIDLLNGLNYLFPSVPAIVVKPQNIQPFITAKPWNAIGWTPITFFPFAIGLGYLLPLDLAFSCWFFYLFWKAEMVVASAMSWDITPGFPYTREQAFGGCIAIAVSVLWTGRGYFLEIGRRAWQPAGESNDRREAMSSRMALLGLLGSFCFLVGFLWYYGMALLWAMVAMLLYFVLSVVVTRIRAELGPPVHDLYSMGPEAVLTRSVGTQILDGRTLTMLDFFEWFNRANRSNPMPFVLEGQKISGVAGISQRRTAAAILLAVTVGIFAAFWAFLHLGYQLGTSAKFFAGTYHSNEAYQNLLGWIASPSHPNAQRNWATGIGFVFCAALLRMRLKFLWWPFHPIGFALSASWSMSLVWLPLLIAWVVKALVLRYGTLKTYRRFEPFFLGLILGEFVVGCLWSLIGLLFHLTTYSFWGLF